MARLLGLAALVLASSGAAPAPKPATSFEITPCTRFGPITPATTRAELDALFGKANVKDADIPIGEGDTQPGTLLFPNDPQKTVAIRWQGEDARRHILELIVTGKASVWKTTSGLTLGTRVKDLEKQNGGPFTFAGLGWDYGGRVSSWGEGGKHFPPGLVVTLVGQVDGLSRAEMDQVTGDRVELHSDGSFPKGLDLRVAQFSCIFPER